MQLDRPAGVRLHPSRVVDLDVPQREAFERCRRGIERVLGGVVREVDSREGTIEATFGLIFSERLTCAVTALDATHSRIAIESRQGPQASAPRESQYVDELARYLMTEAPR